MIFAGHIVQMEEKMNTSKRLVEMPVVPSSPILVTPMMEALSSPETPVLARATRHNIPEGGILHNHRRENLKFSIELVSYLECLHCYFPIKYFFFSNVREFIFF
jgi:hypothetical protein